MGSIVAVGLGVAVGVPSGDSTHPRKKADRVIIKIIGINLILVIPLPGLIIILFINNLIDFL